MSSTKKTRRLDAYIRVSDVHGREGDSFISPRVQEERIRAWATANGHEIVEAFHELDVSGGTMDRPLLNEVMARFDAGETDGLVVFRLDRFGRTLVGALALIEQIHERDGLFASVSDGFDITQETGRLVLRILLSIAQFELERLRSSWREAKARAVDRGIHLSARVPYGYRRPDTPINPRTGKQEAAPLEIDPETAPYVGAIFERRAAGTSWAAIRVWLNESGQLTSEGLPWSQSTLIKVVKNRVYLGEAFGAVKNDKRKPGAHPAIVDEKTWHAAQTRPEARFVLSGRPDSVLRGLVRCAGCRYTFFKTGAARDPATDTRMGCSRHYHRGDCPNENQAIILPVLEDYVLGLFWSHLEKVEFEKVDADVELDQLQHEHENACFRLEQAVTDVELEEMLGRQDFLARVAAFKTRADDTQKQLEQALEGAGRSSGLVVAELRAQWPEMAVDEQRRHLSGAIRHVFVRPHPNGKILPRPNINGAGGLRRAHVAERVHVVWADDPPVEVPRQGARGYVPKPFPFPDANPDSVRVSPS
jgi:DNA invertase Pin-like site-specific DNA recombinase